MEKAYNPILDELPFECDANGRSYKANTDFRNVFAYFRLLESEDQDEDKVFFGLDLFFGDMIAADDVEILIDWIKWFIRRGKNKEEDEEEIKGPVMFDLIVDAGRIFSAFLQIYGINLRKVKMHWWVFGELLEGLPRGTHLADVIEIRSRKFEKWMKPSDRNELQRLKDRFRIGEKVDPFDGLFDMLKGVAN